MSNWNISLNALCPKCKHKITEQDISQNNYQLILLPTLTFQHQVCPNSSPSHSNVAFTYPKYAENNLNLNINLN